jgi:hypothetical protein
VKKLPHDKTKAEAFVTGVLVPGVVKGFFRNSRQMAEFISVSACVNYGNHSPVLQNS